VRQNLKVALGDVSYNKLMSEINPEVQAGVNAGKLLGGSQTGEKTELTASAFHRWKQFILHKIFGVFTEHADRQYEDIGKMLTDPNYLKAIMSKK
jgi:hypothetical protein